MSSGQLPPIESVSWGRITLRGGRRFKDVKLYPGGAREWDWKESGTRHSPGIQLEDVQELLDLDWTRWFLATKELGIKCAGAVVKLCHGVENFPGVGAFEASKARAGRKEESPATSKRSA